MRQKSRRSVVFKVSFYLALIFILGLMFNSLILTESAHGNKNHPAPVIAAPISVNKSATIATDNNGNGHVNPGDVIEYSITVGNGGTAATGVIFSDVLSNELTLVPGSVKAAPVAGDDTYQTIGNTQLQVAASQTISPPGIFTSGNVLSNDNDPTGGTLSASAGAASANGGAVAMNTNGTFTYTPPAGFTGTDTFTYNLTDSPNDGFIVTGTVTINVSALVWYVKNDAPAGGNGTSTAPFNTLTAAQNAPATPTGDTIYV